MKRRFASSTSGETHIRRVTSVEGNCMFLKSWISLCLAILLFGVVGGLRAGQKSNLDTEGARQLLAVLDLLVQRNPDYQEVLNEINTLPADEREDSLDALASRNQADKVIAAQIDSLLNSPAYGLYFRQFRAIDKDNYRAYLNALPYRAMRSPAGLADNLREICLNCDAARKWLDQIVAGVDPEHSRETAMKWLPPGQYETPTTYLIIDGNGDAFAREGVVCLDLWGVALRLRSPEDRFAPAIERDINNLEETLAHEFHHIFAERYLYPDGLQYGDWPQNWIGFFTRKIVSEGMAMQCNPPQGFKRKIMEDTSVVAYWISQLNEKFAAMTSDAITSAEIADWYNQTSDELPRQLLREYLQRTDPESDQNRLFYKHLVDRPMFIYTLGWWMISRILDSPNGRELAIGLLSDPGQLFPLYDKTLGDFSSDLKVTLQQ